MPALAEDSNEVVFTLYFIPADEDIEMYLYELENLEAGTKEMRIEYLRKKRECIDNIF